MPNASILQPGAGGKRTFFNRTIIPQTQPVSPEH